MLSGFGEAALQCTIPPWIQLTASENMRGTWLAIFFTAIPVGTALGYIYSSFIAAELGWQWAFFIEAGIVSPIVFYLFIISPFYPLDLVHHQRHESISLNTNAEYPDYGQRVRMSADMDASPLALSQEDEEDSLLNIGGEALIGSPGENIKSLLSYEYSTGSQNSGGGKGSTRGGPISRKAAPSMWLEFKLVTVRPVFVSMTFAYAAQTAVLIGLSTFGSAFFMGLGFFNTESEASTVFGIVISVSGIAFTPIGGVALDKLNVYSRKRFTDTHDGGASNPSDAECDSAILDNIIALIFWGNAIGMGLMCAVFFVYNMFFYLVLIFLGSGMIFFCNASINMGLMMAVPFENRAFALAVTYASIHAFGDVPSPVIAGLLKDTLAPGCVGGNADDDNVASSKDCRDDNSGLRITMLLITLWLIWTVVGFGAAWLFNKTGQQESLLCCKKQHQDKENCF